MELSTPLEVDEGLRIRGRLSLTVLGPDGTVADRREGDNVMCTAGFTAIAAALAWSGIQDQAANLGVASPTFLTPLWGAVGSGAGSVAKADTALFSELSRQPVGAGASAPATPSVAGLTTWLFYYPNPASAWTVTEAGVFAAATSTAGSGTLLDHWAVSPSVAVSTANTLILQASFAIGP